MGDFFEHGEFEEDRDGCMIGAALIFCLAFDVVLIMVACYLFKLIVQ